MRRTLAAALVLVGLIAAAGCSAPEDPSGTFRPATSGVLTVATSLPAPGFWEGGGTDSLYGGFEYGIALDLADRFGLDLRVVNVPFDRLIEGDLGGADLALAQITFTRTRLADMELTTTYYPANMGVLVVEGESVADLEEARGLRWVVEDGTTQVEFLETIVRPDAPALTSPSREETLRLLETGEADAALLDLPTALATAAPNSAFDVVAQFVTGQWMSAALPKGSGNLEAVNSAMRNIEASGRLLALVNSELRPAFGKNPDSIPVIVARMPRQE